MDKDYIEIKIPILDSVDGMKVVETFTQEQLWYVCAIAKAFEKSEQQVKKQKEVIDKTTNIINDYLKEDYSIYTENEIEVDLIVKLKNILKEVSE